MIGNKTGQLETPIAFIIFNRPDCAKEVFSAIRRARPKKLFVIADGPRTPQEEELCRETRAVVENIDWPCEVHKNYAGKNLGLKERISSGIRWFFDNVETGIILEDDCLPDQSFFRFANEMLERYKNDERVMMITGDNFLSDYEIAESYLFSRFFPIWGWATWRRAWAKYDVHMRSWGKPGNKKYIRDIYPPSLAYMRNHMAKIFDEAYSSKLKSWDTQWLYACLITGGYCIVPRVNLVSNFSLTGTHSSGHNQNLPTYNLYDDGALKHPASVALESGYDNLFYEKSFKEPDWTLEERLRRGVVAVIVRHESVKKIARPAYAGYRVVSAAWRAYKNKATNKLFGVVHMPAAGEKRGDVLISYLTEPFTKTPWQGLSNRHTNYWECYEMARLFSERGYAVDIINWDNHTFVPKKNYFVCVDNQNNLEHLAKHLPETCKLIMHITTSEQKFQNNAEEKRLDALKERRSVSLLPRRQLPPTKDPEVAEYLEGFGNRTVRATYAQYGKPIFPVPISAVKTFPFPEQKDFWATRTSFLWLGGGGAVLKGLDLVLEAFSRNPDLVLHICGPVAAERDFAETYRKELFETPNIHYHGRIDITSPLFGKLVNECGALVYLAFSEGTSGAVVQAMHAGLVPIITPQTGVAEEAGCIIIEDPSVDSVSSAVRSFAALPPETIRNKAHATWSYARSHYTREAFSAAYTSFIDTVLRL